jgi:hypothetical protein
MYRSMYRYRKCIVLSIGHGLCHSLCHDHGVGLGHDHGVVIGLGHGLALALGHGMILGHGVALSFLAFPFLIPIYRPRPIPVPRP